MRATVGIFYHHLILKLQPLIGPYFEATVEGVALRVNSSGAVYENFILTIKGWLPDTNGDEILSYCALEDGPCELACTALYEACLLKCDQTNPTYGCYGPCTIAYGVCLYECTQ